MTIRPEMVPGKFSALAHDFYPVPAATGQHSTPPLRPGRLPPSCWDQRDTGRASAPLRRDLRTRRQEHDIDGRMVEEGPILAH